ncbi:MAG: tRNA (adenosine(37)-N6)-threonylcarbamoyltransferase complex transferase subunit TsaD [Acidobacteria bacterium]|nr:MAG: tRNA (adenosine(37)-N6)-threonylcarbamoyltransferase complex transferase subunit TsaD [Acidobacteriota bacterium]PYY23743.1 MAG: tRNA (adenosine(37)-N6)-threonylcarbamoyltransferase complex transferase subunit TsaD [Acidobacteriota bacterium]
MLILGIESSCDETAAAIVRDGEQVLSNVVASQIATHMPYGGVVPELASREHLRAIVPVVREALSRAEIRLDQVDALAVTQGPGLAGSLLVGITYAKALSFALSKPVIAVNHLEGHIHAVLLEHRQSTTRDLSLPALALVVSGGHTHLYAVHRSKAGTWQYRSVGHTLDDAAGEAFDKVAKLLALSYPGGPIIEALAKHGNPCAIAMPQSQIKAQEKRRVRGEDQTQRYDFSFSGIKTAVLRFVEMHAMQASIEKRARALAKASTPRPEDFLPHLDQLTLDLIASFQDAVIRDLVGKTLRAAEDMEVESLIVSGGVASNETLRTEFVKRGEAEGISVFFPSPVLSTDNAAMIAAAAYPKLLAHEFAAEHFSAQASLALG